MSAKTRALVLLVLASFVAGVIGQYFWPGEPLSAADYAFAVVGTFLIFAWYRIDAKQRGYRRPMWLNIGVILLALVAMPYYFFRTRGFKGGLIATALAALLVVATSALTGLGQMATYLFLLA